MPAGRLPRCEIIPPSSKVLDMVIHNDMTLVLHLKELLEKKRWNTIEEEKVEEEKKEDCIACVCESWSNVFLYLNN